MTMKIGWRDETTFATNPLSPADDYVYYFGDFLEDHKVPVPWHETKLTPVYRHDILSPVNLVAGAKSLQFDESHCPLGADDWVYALGDVDTNVITIGEIGETMRSRSVYVETSWGDCVVAKGCVTKSLDFYANLMLPHEIKTTFIGTEVEEETVLSPTSGSSPRYHADLEIDNVWAWADEDTATLDSSDITGDTGQIKDIHLHVENIISQRKRTSLLDAKKVGVGVMLNFNIETDDPKNNLFVQAVRDDEENDFYYKWKKGAYYWILEISNIKMRKISASERADQDTVVYAIQGQAYYDADGATADPVKLTVSDGVTYS